MEHRDASHARAPRVLRADRLEVRAPVAEPEVEAEHLDGAGRRLHALHRVDEELDAGRRETIADMLRRLVVMVPEAGEASTLERGERRERLAKERITGISAIGRTWHRDIGGQRIANPIVRKLLSLDPSTNASQDLAYGNARLRQNLRNVGYTRHIRGTCQNSY